MKYKLPALILTLFLILALVPAAFADDGDEAEVSTYCIDMIDRQHPVGARIAERYAADYETVMTWFCVDHFGFGEIMLAFETSKVMNPDADVDFDFSAYAQTLLDKRTELGGWGLVWKDLGFTGRPKGDDWAGGPPEWAGPKDEDKDKDKDKDKVKDEDKDKDKDKVKDEEKDKDKDKD
jgi:hypothetical protein